MLQEADAQTPHAPILCHNTTYTAFTANDKECIALQTCTIRFEQLTPEPSQSTRLCNLVSYNTLNANSHSNVSFTKPKEVIWMRFQSQEVSCKAHLNRTQKTVAVQPTVYCRALPPTRMPGAAAVAWAAFAAACCAASASFCFLSRHLLAWNTR